MDEETGLVRSAVGYPFAGAAGTRFVFGTVLYFFGVVVSAGAVAIALRSNVAPYVALAVGAVGLLSLLPVAGYAAATIRAVLDDEPEPPGFGDWGALVRDGRRIALVALAYAVPLGIAAAGVTVLSDGGSLAPSALAVIAAAAGYALVASYVFPAAVVAVVHEGMASAAWDVGTLRDAVVDHRYASGWIVAALVAVGGGAMGVVSAPFVVGFAVLFAAQVAGTYAVTRGVIVALDLSLEDPPAPPASGYVAGWEDGPRRKELSDGRLGGSLLPTTPDGDGDDEIDREEPSGSSGPLARTGGGGAADRSGPDDGAGAGGTASAAESGTESSGDETGSDIAPFVEGDDEIDTDDDE